MISLLVVEIGLDERAAAADTGVERRRVQRPSAGRDRRVEPLDAVGRAQVGLYGFDLDAAVAELLRGRPMPVSSALTRRS